MIVTLAPRFSSDKPQQFRSYSALLRWLADHNGQDGQRRNAASFYLGSRTYGKPETRTIDPHGAFYFNQRNWNGQVTQEQFEKLFTLQERYRSFVRHLQEVVPQWRNVDRIHWADNSVDIVQEDKDGRRRTVQETGPHGDICY